MHNLPAIYPPNMTSPSKTREGYFIHQQILMPHQDELRQLHSPAKVQSSGPMEQPSLGLFVSKQPLQLSQPDLYKYEQSRNQQYDKTTNLYSPIKPISYYPSFSQPASVSGFEPLSPTSANKKIKINLSELINAEKREQQRINNIRSGQITLGGGRRVTQNGRYKTQTSSTHTVDKYKAFNALENVFSSLPRDPIYIKSQGWSFV